ncbi:hypothetical protein [Hespellia stercorisuis]|nr:hypothetical protein [Hespellia stercorisuis]
MTVATPGMTLLITDTTGTTRCMFQLDTNGRFHSIPLSENGLALVTLIENTCEDSNVSVLYIGGTGGSARGGVTRKPIELTKAIHDGKAHLTIGGANAFVMPGGGINFMVDTGKVVPNSFTWVPTPATVAPVEYTMTKTDYEAIGGHMDAIQNLDDLKGA